MSFFKGKTKKDDRTISLDDESNKKKKALLRKAYSLGYEVGYFKHFEGMAWIQDILGELRRKGKRLNCQDEVESNYTEGIEAGRRGDDRLLQSFKMGEKSKEKVDKVELESQTLKKEVLERRRLERIRREASKSTKTRDRGSYQALREPNQLARPGAVESPGAITAPRQIKAPRMVRSIKRK